MIVSINWLKKFTEIDIPIDELAVLIGSRLVEVEEVIDLGARYKGIVAVKVMSVNKHENADTLKVCLVDDGGAVKDAERKDGGLIEIVCGADNVREGMVAAWLPPGTTVPATVNLEEPLVLTARNLRGVISNGMLASAKELAIGENHTGIIELNHELKPGSSVAEALELDDYLLDIENKSLTHRPDGFGLIGFAREVAAISGKQFTSPEWYTALELILDEMQKVDGIKEPKVTIENPELCPRYEAVVIANVDPTKPSPIIIQSYLKRVGIRPINEVVDITNYLMVVSGHPTHAFDYDAFLKAGGTDFPDIKIRAAKKGEKLTLLDDRTVELTDEDILIVSGDTPVGLAGAMGGAETEVTPSTKHIILESATFNLYNLRSTAMRHAVYSDAATRFTKGQPAAQTAPVLASALRMMTDIANGVRASKIIDEYPGKSEPVSIEVDVERIHNVLGSEIPYDEIIDTLENAEFKVTPVPSSQSPFPAFDVQVPFWRQDIHIPEDIIEEIGRLRGFDNIEPVLPDRPFTAIKPSDFDTFRGRIRKILASGGANDILTYNFVHESLFKKAGQDPSKAFKITNAISPELQYYRMSLTPSLLDKVYPNIKNGFREFALFEMNKVHIKGVSDKEEPELPLEKQRLSLVFAADSKAASGYGGAAFYQAKYYLDFLFSRLGASFEVEPINGQLDEESGKQMASMYEPGHSGVVKVEGKVVGIAGEFTRLAGTSFKLPDFAAGFELGLVKTHTALAGVKSTYRPLSRYPGTDQDICLRVADGITYRQVVDVASNQLKKSGLEWKIEPVDIYKRQDDTDSKQITIRIHMTDHSKTITTEEANTIINGIAVAAKEQLKAERV